MEVNTNEVYVLGAKNYKFINQMNKKAKLFNDIKILEHPRYIQQYKSRDKDLYINKYITHLTK